MISFYGFRGGQDVMDLFSPYEMLLHYIMERLLPPTTTPTQSRATWTEEGKTHRGSCGETRVKNTLKTWGSLHGRRRRKPDSHAEHAPTTWATAMLALGIAASSSSAYMVLRESPPSYLSMPENARVLRVYLRPWTLNLKTSAAWTKLTERSKQPRIVPRGCP